jgi:hypothetical protein
VDLLANYKGSTGAAAVGATVMRCHLLVYPHTLAANDSWWIGVSVGDLDDITGAVTTNALVPNPRDNPYIDWMLSRKFVADQNESFSTPGYGGAILDLRSKRRMHQVQQAFTLTVMQDTVGTPAKAYDVFARTLLALP